MNTDEKAVKDVLQRCMVARIATLSRHGRPSINPLYFVLHTDHIWLGTMEWTLAARNVQADPRVSILFEREQDKRAHRILQISGRASVRTEQKVQRSYGLRVARKYLLTPGGIRHALLHIRQILLRGHYAAQNAEKGRPCVIEVIPEHADFLKNNE